MRFALALAPLAFLLAVTAVVGVNAAYLPTHGEFVVYASAARVAFYVCLAVGGCAYAIRRGGVPERVVGIAILVGLAADPLLHQFFKLTFDTVDPTHLIIDVSRFAAFAAVALTAHRFWPIWISSFQLLALGAHVVKAMNLAIHPVIYAAMSVMWSYGMLVVLILATRYHQRVIARGETRKSWSDFSHRRGSRRGHSPND